MKFIAIVVVALALSGFTFVEDVYSLQFKTIDGKKINLNQFKGKKILFVILPLDISDPKLPFSDLLQFQIKNNDSVIIIGIPAEEAGFKKSEVESVKFTYGKLSNHFIVSEIMKTKKGSEQHNIFQWLTNLKKNNHFAQDAQGVGSKYFISENGELYAVLSSEVKLTDPIVERITSRRKSVN